MLDLHRLQSSLPFTLAWLAVAGSLSCRLVTGQPRAPTESPQASTPLLTDTPSIPTAAIPPTPTYTPSPPTPPGDLSGMEGFRNFAVQIQDALERQDTSFFGAWAVEDQVTCLGDELLGPCAGQPPGTVLRGVPSGIAETDAIAYLVLDEYVARLQAWFEMAMPSEKDQYGSGSLTLYAIAHQYGDNPLVPFAGETYQAILTGIFATETAPMRQARILYFEFWEGSWRLVADLFAPIPQTAARWLSGECQWCYDEWQTWNAAEPPPTPFVNLAGPDVSFHGISFSIPPELGDRVFARASEWPSSLEFFFAPQGDCRKVGCVDPHC